MYASNRFQEDYLYIETNNDALDNYKINNRDASKQTNVNRIWPFKTFYLQYFIYMYIDDSIHPFEVVLILLKLESVG
jgi:hypothetical protein